MKGNVVGKKGTNEFEEIKAIFIDYLVVISIVHLLKTQLIKLKACNLWQKATYHLFQQWQTFIKEDKIKEKVKNKKEKERKIAGSMSEKLWKVDQYDKAKQIGINNNKKKKKKHATITK